MQVRNQGAVRAHVWTSAAGLANAQTSLRALSALGNDATAWDATHARELLKDAKGDIQLSRTHARHLKAFQTKDSAEHLSKLDDALDGALKCVDKLQGPIAKGVEPGERQDAGRQHHAGRRGHRSRNRPRARAAT